MRMIVTWVADIELLKIWQQSTAKNYSVIFNIILWEMKCTAVYTSALV